MSDQSPQEETTPFGGSEPSNRELAWRSYELLFNHYQEDLKLFWVRANFFLIVNGGLLAFVAQIKNPNKTYVVSVCVAGCFVSVLWWGVLTASLAWINQWRECMISFDWTNSGNAVPPGMLAINKVFTGPWQPTTPTTTTRSERWRDLKPSRLALGLPVVFVGTWLFLAVWTLRN